MTSAISIGKQDFASLRENHYFYVDKTDFIRQWWMLAFLMGMLAMPVTGRLFCGFEDKGWIFSKVLAIAVTGFLTWFLVAV